MINHTLLFGSRSNRCKSDLRSQVTKGHRNSPVLVPIPTWKFLFPVQLPKRYEAGETRGEKEPELNNTHNSLWYFVLLWHYWQLPLKWDSKQHASIRYFWNKRKTCSVIISKNWNVNHNNKHLLTIRIVYLASYCV